MEVLVSYPLGGSFASAAARAASISCIIAQRTHVYAEQMNANDDAIEWQAGGSLLATTTPS